MLKFGIKQLACLSASLLSAFAMMATVGADEATLLNSDSVTFDRTMLAVSAKAVSEDVALIENGVYHIKNTSGGKYLDTYDVKYDSNGHAYTAKRSEQDGQDFKISYLGEGKYSITAMSEGGVYSLYTSDGELKKQKDSEHVFSITAYGQGYVIGSEDKVLTENISKSRYGDSLVGTKEFDGSASQIWELERVNATGMTISSSAKRVKLYSITKLKAAVVPAYLTENVKWSSSDESIVIVDEHGSFCALREGSATVNAVCGDFSVECVVEVRSDTAYTWYSQHNMYSGGWDAAQLNSLYFSAGGSYKRYIIDGYNGKQDWMDEGCAIASCAMVLHNLGATMTDGYDFRTDTQGNLEADPYTVSLANSRSTGSTTGSGCLYNNPIYIANSSIASAFKVDGKSISADVSYSPSKKAIKEALDEHPEGVIVKFKKGYNTHYIVFTECINPDAEKSSDYEFIVCDSAAYDAEDGDHVAFSECSSYKNSYYRYSNMIQLITWNVEKAE
jgi:hypothetical protein